MASVLTTSVLSSTFPFRSSKRATRAVNPLPGCPEASPRPASGRAIPPVPSADNVHGGAEPTSSPHRAREHRPRRTPAARPTICKPAGQLGSHLRRGADSQSGAHYSALPAHASSFFGGDPRRPRQVFHRRQPPRAGPVWGVVRGSETGHLVRSARRQRTTFSVDRSSRRTAVDCIVRRWVAAGVLFAMMAATNIGTPLPTDRLCRQVPIADGKPLGKSLAVSRALVAIVQ